MCWIGILNCWVGIAENDSRWWSSSPKRKCRSYCEHAQEEDDDEWRRFFRRCSRDYAPVLHRWCPGTQDLPKCCSHHEHWFHWLCCCSSCHGKALLCALRGLERCSVLKIGNKAQYGVFFFFSGSWRNNSLVMKRSDSFISFLCNMWMLKQL